MSYLLILETKTVNQLLSLIKKQYPQLRNHVVYGTCDVQITKINESLAYDICTQMLNNYVQATLIEL